jgi:uncharacterized protein YndB with AHSA1/START domain
MTTMTEVVKVFRVFIRATPEDVWKAITDPDFTARYYYGTRLESTLAPGDAFRYRAEGGGPLILDGELVEADPPRRLVQTFRALWSEELAAEPPSRVVWEIEPDDEQGLTQLTVTHDRLDEAPHTAEAIAGWHYVLSGLKTLLETGRPMVG